MIRVEPAMAQVIEIKENRHAWPCARHPRDTVRSGGLWLIQEFFRTLSSNRGSAER
jgi:hypothetical protein